MSVSRRVLSMEDRAEIAAGCKAGWPVVRIASQLGRHRSIVYRELSRNSYKTRGYNAVHADCQAQRRRSRPQVGKVAACPVIGARVLADLRRGRSPRAIAGRLRAEARFKGLRRLKNSPDAFGLQVSHEAIYQFIYALPKGELAQNSIMLHTRRKSRKPRKTPGRRNPIVGMVSIDARPQEVADRGVPGHWEGDLIIGQDGASAAVTLVERTTRFLLLQALPLGRTADATKDAVIKATKILPTCIAKSITWDQGREMASHLSITQTTGMPVYFAHAHSPWERGTNENTNGRVRRYLPKGTPITAHQSYLTAIADELNEVPRECLDWRTPREAYEELINQKVA